MNATGMNTESRTNVIATMGAVISPIASRAASAGVSWVLFQLRLDRFYHDDGVIDHDADRENKRKQRDRVGRKAERHHHSERSDQRDRHGDQRNERSAHASKEQVNDNDDEDEGLDQGLDDLMDAFIDELRRVVGHLVLDALRKRRLELLKQLADSFSGGDRVAAWRLVDAEHGRSRTILPTDLFRRLRRQLDTRDITDSDK